MPTNLEFYQQTLHHSSTDGIQKEDKTEYVPRAQFQDITEIRRFLDREVYLTSQFYSRSGRKKNNKAFKEYAVVLRRIDDKDDPSLSSINLEIQSKKLRKKFRDLITDSASGTVDLEADPISIPHPFELLFHSRDAIQKYLSESQDPELKEEMNLITDFIKSNEELRATQQTYDQLWPHKKINCPLLWTIYRPGQLIFLNIHGIEEVWVFKHAYLDSTPEGLTHWVICGQGMDFDGTCVGKVEKRIKVATFSGIIDIESLPIVPMSFYPDDDMEEIMRRVNARGKRFERLQKPKPRSYQGPLWTPDPQKGLQTGEGPSLQINEPVIIDCRSFLDEHPNFRPELLPDHADPDTPLDKEGPDLFPNQVNSDTPPDQAEPDILLDKAASEPPDEVIYVTVCRDDSGTPSGVKAPLSPADTLERYPYLLYPALIPGYALDRKLWGYFLVEGLWRVEWGDGVFESLEMDKKDLIRSLVQGHKTRAKEDVTRRKGKGLVIMLTGPPGTGKTTMAVGISECCERPLYQTSCREFINDSENMEKKMQGILKYAQKWDALVVLDEAETLLSNGNDSGIVSVFFRLIENYSCILFLITNKADSIDEAVYSRVHLTLDFEPLTPNARQKIWRNVLEENIRSSKAPSKPWNDTAFQILGGFDVNGHTINNLVWAASCYARSEDKPLGLKHLAEVMQLSPLENRKKTEEFLENQRLLDQLVGKVA